MPFVTKCCNSSQEWGGLQHFYATPSTPRRVSIKVQVLDRQSVSECSKYAIHHIIAQNIPKIWLFAQQNVTLQRQNNKSSKVIKMKE